jgi:hypothetical protein
MYLDGIIQSRAMNMNIDIKGLCLIDYLINNNLIGKSKANSSEAQKVFPIIFCNSSEVKKGYNNLEESGIFVWCNWNRGLIQFEFNKDKLSELYSREMVVVEKKSSAPTSVEISDEVKRILAHYRQFEDLPSVKSLTKIRLDSILKALESTSVESIEEGIEYASKQTWLTSKAEERWCDLSWIMKNIGEFLEGGKYYKGEVKKIDKIKTDENELFKGRVVFV